MFSYYAGELMNRSLLKQILFSICIIWSPLAFGQAMTLAQFKQWLNTMSVTIPEPSPFHNIYSNPTGGTIRACRGATPTTGAPATGAAGAGGALPRTCFTSTVVLGPDPRLGAITDQDRLGYLIHYLYKYLEIRPLGAPLPDVTWFTNPAKVNTINLYAGLIRCSLRKDQLFVQTKRAGLASALPASSGLPGTTQASVLLSFDKANSSIYGTLDRELKLLDFLFLDAPLWNIMAVNTGKCSIGIAPAAGAGAGGAAAGAVGR